MYIYTNKNIFLYVDIIYGVVDGAIYNQYAQQYIGNMWGHIEIVYEAIYKVGYNIHTLYVVML
jgi:hypothetical protein